MPDDSTARESMPVERCVRCQTPLSRLGGIGAGRCLRCLMDAALAGDAPDGGDGPGDWLEALTPRDDPLPATTAAAHFGRYELLEEIARGG